jgi:transposase
VTDIIRIGLDTSKSVFQLHGVDAAEQPVVRKQLRRGEMIKFFEKLPPVVVALEACGASHHWARLLSSFGHEVKLIAPQLAKPYVKRGKNDAADAEALCEAASRPTMRFVPVKSADQQAALMLLGVRTRLIKRRTQLANAIRGFAAEFGVTTSACAGSSLCWSGSRSTKPCRNWRGSFLHCRPENMPSSNAKSRSSNSS